MVSLLLRKLLRVLLRPTQLYPDDLSLSPQRLACLKAHSREQREAHLDAIQIQVWTSSNQEVKNAFARYAEWLDQQMAPAGEQPLLRQNRTASAIDYLRHAQ